jgi:ABC-2 type transport system ATP-binding protein
MLELNNIVKRYGKKTALSVDKLVIPENDFVGLVGNNGAGKTTMLSLVLDLIKPQEGWVKSKGVIVSETDDWKSYTGSYLHEGFLIPFLKPSEFLEFIGNLHSRNNMEVKEFFNVNSGFFTERFNGNKLIRELSAGNRNKLGILGAILPQPEILVLDEPFASLDPRSRSWLKAKLRSLHEEGVTILVSSHDLNHITEVCSRIILLEEGEIIKDTPTSAGTLTELESYFSVAEF